MVLQGVLEPRYGGCQPAGDRDPKGVGGDRLKAPELHGAREERGAVRLLPEVECLTLIGVLQEVQVRCDHGVRHGLRRGVELGKHLHDRQCLQGRPVGLVGPVPRSAIDEERGTIEVTDAVG
jgi:hypothetical protein